MVDIAIAVYTVRDLTLRFALSEGVLVPMSLSLKSAWAMYDRHRDCGMYSAGIPLRFALSECFLDSPHLLLFGNTDMLAQKLLIIATNEPNPKTQDYL